MLKMKRFFIFIACTFGIPVKDVEQNVNLHGLGGDSIIADEEVYFKKKSN